MKKRSGYLVFMLALFFLASANSVHAQQVDSEVGITFYQKNYKDQVVSFEKITPVNEAKQPNRETINSDKGLINQLLPNTGEKQQLELLTIGLLLISIILFVVARRRKKGWKADE
ncbi:LPXTG-motif cell wall anchor domain protein [Enterococcus faecalis TX1346]|uniref:LPXTG cell wall anchor domain-containing protein n=1 Tax=Enterococcus faecalis TaxID=1351 RepID=UPI0001F0B0AC|nr:LPXTG cell wall anchor domain-containing protein [Enterococcus faecalis]EFU16770.1 LPXTG-motif cell wall anchor domain protein [Enterococcus faecalis TX1346]